MFFAVLVCKLFVTALVTSSVASSRDTVLALRDNVVRVEVEFSDGSKRTGFAIVVGEYMDGILLVTPNTFVRDLDRPDNPSIKVITRYFTTPDLEDEAVLLENSDPTRNIAVILATARLYNRVFDWNAKGCIWDVKLNAEAWFIGNLSGWHVPASPGWFTESYDNGIARAQLHDIDTSSIGAPVIVNGSVVGIIENIGEDGVSVLSIEEVLTVVEGWTLPWQLRSDRICENPNLSFNSLRTDEQGLRELALLVFRPGTYYTKAFELLKPTRADLESIFDYQAVNHVRAYSDSLILEEPNSKTDSNTVEYVELVGCVTVEAGFTRLWKGLQIDVKSRVKYCNVMVNDRKFNGFWYVNGHWIWLPTS